MKIIKPGLTKQQLEQKTQLSGICAHCDCVFECLISEVTQYTRYNETSWGINCPNPDCGKKVFDLVLKS